jgi:chromosome segregation ATPase
MTLKRISLFLLAFLALNTFAHADDVQPVNSQVNAIVAANTTPAAKATAILGLLNTASTINEAEKADFKTHEAKKSAIEMADAALTKYLPPHNTAVANLAIEQGQHNDAVHAQDTATAQHNANRCVAPSDNPGVCSAYNAEADQLNQRASYLTNEAAGLNKRADDLNAEKAKLDEIQKNLSADILEYTAWSKSYNANVAQNQANIALLVSTLKQVLKSNDDCKKAIGSGTAENMSEVCGQLFDGNAIHDGKTNRGTGTNEFGRGGNPTNEQEPHN